MPLSALRSYMSSFETCAKDRISRSNQQFFEPNNNTAVRGYWLAFSSRAVS